MEEKLELVKKMMELEKDKRGQNTGAKDGQIWRGATTKKNIKGYSDAVLANHKQKQPNLPPTNMVTDPNVKPQQRVPSKQGGFQPMNF